MYTGVCYVEQSFVDHVYRTLEFNSTLPPQATGWREDGRVEHVPFPFDRDEEVPIPEDDLLNHPCLSRLEAQVDLAHTCGYLSMLRTGM